jgi:tetraacyldisaccharide 4'-kinase
LNPLSATYAAFAGTRNRLYDGGFLKTQRLRAPVVSIGNLSVGGSGKTPFVILLGQLMQQRGIRFDVLSRGYGRKTRGALAVDLNGAPNQFGDEPLLISRHLQCPVVVGESRHQAGLLAENRFGSQLHLLDDGFQHRSLARDFDIVLLTAEDLRDQLLPSGRLREPLSSLRRADAIVLMEDMDFSPPSGKSVWRVRRALEISSAPERPITFCGIARPHKFIKQLKSQGVEPVVEKFYRDHHAYTPREVRELLELRDRSGARGFITTEKDEINLGPNAASLAPLAIARVRMELLNAADALDTIFRVIGECKPTT